VKRPVSKFAFSNSACTDYGEGRLLLSDWLVILTSHYNHETGVASFDPDDVSAVDGAFTSCVPLQAIPRLGGACVQLLNSVYP
jgi:hypothetical protein